MISTSVGATTLGRGADTLILDDPVSANQVLSDTERKSANGWIDSVWGSRLNHPSTGSMVLVMQRLHQFDPTGYLLKHEAHRWTVLSIPLVAEQDETWIFPISGTTVQRRAGEVLMPGRFTEDVVEEHRSRRLVFASQYQQRPVPLEGNIIKRQHVRFYGGIDPGTGQLDEQLPRSFELKIMSVDCAFKDLANSDFVAICVIGVQGSKRFLLNVVNTHLSAAATEAAIRQQRSLLGPINTILIEDKANGSAVIERLKRTVSGVIGVNPEGGKTARLFAAAAEWEAGNWYVNRDASWAEPFIEQITGFPNSPNDDMADAMSQAACWLLKRRPGPIVVMSNAFTGEILYQY
jgi:predicted phage terminase large subunit-like protein